MANRYWVGGTAAWDGTAGTKWALTSGGAGGQAIPTSADDVFLDASSGANTVTISTGNTGAKSLTCTGFTGTLAGSANITVSGSVTLASTMTHTYSGILTINATGTLTTAGKTCAGVSLSAAGGTITLGDAFTTSLNFLITTGTVNTNNFNVTAVGIGSAYSSARTFALGSSLITLTGTAGANIGATNLTVTGTATIKFTNASSKNFDSNYAFTNITIDQGGAGAIVFVGSNTFNDITNSYSATGATTLTFTSGTTTTLSQFTATGAVGKVLTLGASTTSQAILRKSSTWYMGANSTDGGNNTGLTFTAGGGIDYLSVSYINGAGIASTGNFLMFF